MKEPSCKIVRYGNTSELLHKAVSPRYDITGELLHIFAKYMTSFLWKIVVRRETPPFPSHHVERHVSRLTFSSAALPRWVLQSLEIFPFDYEITDYYHTDVIVLFDILRLLQHFSQHQEIF
ncbi:MAG: hypothetical protein ACE5IR_15810 [bacterium]